MSHEPKQPSPSEKRQDDAQEEKPQEVGGFESRVEPTRYGDWDVDGRCSDF